jgi:ribosomal protein L30
MASKDSDNYLDIQQYSGHAGSAGDPAGVVSFKHSDGQLYFAVVGAAGEVLLRSEGYPNKSGCDNGMASVNKNRGSEERYAVQDEAGQFFVALRAGNRQEIARSGALASSADAWALIARLVKGPEGGRSAANAAKPATARTPLTRGLRVTQLKSTFGELRNIISSVKGLGLRHRHDSVIVADTRENRGMINTAIHLLKVEEAK